MNDLKNSISSLFNKMFKYEEKQEYNFIIPETDSEIDLQNSKQNEAQNIPNPSKDQKNVFPTLSVNLECLQVKYNALINSDVVIREFTLTARNKQYNAFIIYIDGMVDSKIINDFILNPLMLKNRANLYDGDQNKIVSEAVTHNITVKRVKRFDLADYILNSLMPQNSVKKTNSFDELISRYKFWKLCFIYRYFR